MGTRPQQKWFHRSGSSIGLLFPFLIFFRSLFCSFRSYFMYVYYIIMVKLWRHGKLASVVRCRVPARSSALVFIQICEWLPSLRLRIHCVSEACIRTATAAAAAYCILSDDCFIVRSLFVSIYSIYFFAQRWVCPFLLHRHSTSRTSFFVLELMLVLLVALVMHYTHRRNGENVCPGASDKAELPHRK